MRSAWGLAIHPPSGKVAISSNSYNVLVFNLCPSSPPTASAATPSPPIRLQDSQARLEASFEIRDAHLNNIPTLNFSPCGTMLSSASIDSTFAIYDMFDSGRLIYQSATPVPDAADPTRDTERCWITHWISQPVPVPVSAADPVWQAWLEQRGSTVRFVVPVDYAYVSPTRRSIFDRSDDRHVPFVDERSPDSSYDDTQPLEHQPVRPTMYKSTFATRRKEKRKRSTSHLESLAAPSQAQNETPLASGSVPSAHSFRWSGLSDDSDDSNLEHLPRHRRQPNEKDNNGMLMLVCREETISLCRVRRDLRDAPGATTSSSNDNPLRNQHVQMLDSIRISPKDITLRQVMYTNVIEVPQLSLLIVTAVSTGVILLRVMQPVLDPLLDGPGMLDISTNPVLLIERVITPEFDNVIGTCVVEREADTLAATSFELWILSQDGRIECWDISRGELAVDISARF